VLVVGKIKGERSMALDIAIDCVKNEIHKNEKRLDYLKECLVAGKKIGASIEAMALTRKNIDRRIERLDELRFSLENLLALKSNRG
jgi:hypothetical protein